jgi:transcription initiation factor TFIIH subunit 2
MAYESGDMHVKHGWEGSFEMPWHGLSEDDLGHLRDVADLANSASRTTRSQVGVVQRGIIRYVYLVIDMSKAMHANDFRPNRASAMRSLLSSFIVDFLGENPISQLGIIILRNGRAEKLSELSGSKSAHLHAIQSAVSTGGDASLQNALDIACSLMNDVPKYGHREILVIFGGYATKDPGDIFLTVEKLKRSKVHVSIIGLFAEMHILRSICEETGGVFEVASCVEHIKRAFSTFLQPPTTRSSDEHEAAMIEMGFPTREDGLADTTLGYDGAKIMNLDRCYKCPRCHTRVLEIPTICAVCSLPLITAPHLAHSYHHLFPLIDFSRIETSNSSASKYSSGVRCAGCNCDVNNYGGSKKEFFQCPQCIDIYCEQCEMFLHESLHNCPGCLNRQP